MKNKMELSNIWKNRNKIFEGVKNNVFKKEHIEAIAEERMSICKECPFMDIKGDSCSVSGTQPCCSQCGCSLKYKVRSLSSACGDEENPRWHALLDDLDEEDKLKEQLGYDDEKEASKNS